MWLYDQSKSSCCSEVLIIKPQHFCLAAINLQLHWQMGVSDARAGCNVVHGILYWINLVYRCKVHMRQRDILLCAVLLGRQVASSSLWHCHLYAHIILGDMRRNNSSSLLKPGLKIDNLAYIILKYIIRPRVQFHS